MTDIFVIQKKSLEDFIASYIAALFRILKYEYSTAKKLTGSYRSKVEKFIPIITPCSLYFEASVSSSEYQITFSK